MNTQEFRDVYGYALENKCSPSIESCDLLALLENVESHERTLKSLYNGLMHDGYCWWLPDWAISEEHNTDVENKPTFEEFVKVIKSYE